MAVGFEGLLREGTIGSYAQLARLGGVSRARITQILNLRHLAPAIQEEILLLGSRSGVEKLTEPAVRQLTATMDWRRQTALFQELIQNPAVGGAGNVSESLGNEQDSVVYGMGR